ncbi:type II secretion system F family protein [Anaerovibrio sp.]|uniref:type II secretion system F family protein n=1 Tax=Anaerovibrio sp. TaxID=1872532 RepID=UPI003F1635E6
MEMYEFEGIDVHGLRRRGSISAADRTEAAQRLRERGMTLTGLHRESRLKAFLRRNMNHAAGSFRIHFCRQMYVMLGAGLPITEAVKIFSEDTDAFGRRNMEKLLEYLENGYSLSESMQVLDGVFSKTMIVMVKGGELSGNLAEVFESMYTLLRKRHENEHKLKMALAYPGLLCILSAVLLVFLLYQVLPVFAEVFAGFNAELPWSTQLLLSLGSAPGLWVPMFVAALAAILLLKFVCRRFRGIGIAMDRLLLFLPIWGKLCMRSEQAVFLSTLSMLVRSGIRINHGLDVARNMGRNMYWQFAYESMSIQLEQGYSLGVCMEKSGLFPAMVLSMVKAGEQSGEMARMLAYAGEACQGEADLLLEKVNVLAEPVVMLLLGGVTGFIVMSTVLPILDLMSVM